MEEALSGETRVSRFASRAKLERFALTYLKEALRGLERYRNVATNG